MKRWCEKFSGSRGARVRAEARGVRAQEESLQSGVSVSG